MQKRRGGRRRNHRPEKPRVEGHLRGLGDAGEREERNREHDQIGTVDADVEELVERQRTELGRAQQQRDDERDAAEEVHDDLTKRVADGLVGFSVADEQKRADRGNFPPREHPQHVVGEHDDVHGGEEHEHDGEERRPAILRTRRLMSLEILHVSECVHADARADDADDERHEQRKGVEVQPVDHLDLRREHELEHEGEQDLNDGEHRRDNVAILESEGEDDRGDHAAHAQADQIDCVGLKRYERHRSPEVQQGDGDRCKRDHTRSRVDDHVPRCILSHHEKQCGNYQRKHDEENDHFHHCPPSLDRRRIIAAPLNQGRGNPISRALSINSSKTRFADPIY